ncbi:MAG TPA: YciI family protein [Ignavibacteria bacterium]|nr:YciI family protein [Ignavibacteria bacterium]
MEIRKKYFCYCLHLYPRYFEKSNWTEKDNETVGIHFRYLQDYLKKGTLFLAGRTINDPMSERDFGIAILEVDSKEEAKSIMDNDPAIKGNIMYAELFEFSLALLRS